MQTQTLLVHAQNSGKMPPHHHSVSVCFQPNLGNGDGTSFGHGDIEVPGRHSKDDIACSVSLPALDEGEVACDGLLHDVIPAFKHA